MSLSFARPHRPLQWPPMVEQLSDIADGLNVPLYLVGGVVRDALRGLDATDFDLATPGNGLEIARSLADGLNGAYYPVDLERRTGRVLLERDNIRIQIDVASFRDDNLIGDLVGRDFTVNAMAVDLNNLEFIIDPLDGQKDLFQRRILRQCSPTSVTDDPIRALRAVRHSVALNVRMDSEVIRLCRAAVELLQDEEGKPTQPERVRDEWFKMIESRECVRALRVLDRLGLMTIVSPVTISADAMVRAEWLDRLLLNIGPTRDDNAASNLLLGAAVMVLDRHRVHLQHHLRRHYADGRKRKALLIMSALCWDQDSEWDIWVDWLHLSNEERNILLGLQASRNHLQQSPPDDARGIFRYYKATGEPGVDGLLVLLADWHIRNSGKADPILWGKLLNDVVSPLLDAFFTKPLEMIAPSPLITGHDILSLPNPPSGSLIGEVLAQVLEEQAVGSIQSRDEAIRFAQDYLSKRNQE